MGAFTNLLGNSPRVAVIEVFAENKDESFSAPELEGITGKSRRAVYYTLGKLVNEGLIIIVDKEQKPAKYLLNQNDIRSRILPYIESVLVVGQIESSLKRDENLDQKEMLLTSILAANECIESSTYGQIQDSPDITISDAAGLAPYALSGSGLKNHGISLTHQDLVANLIKPEL